VPRLEPTRQQGVADGTGDLRGLDHRHEVHRMFFLRCGFVTSQTAAGAQIGSA
jgi:hypothetical protein